MRVLKFGGSSVATPERIQSVIEIVRPQLANGPFALVFSAFGGVTDQLIQVSGWALQGDTGYLSLLRQVEERHIQAVKALVAVQKQSPVLAQVKSMLNELEDVLHGIYLVRERTERTLDFVMSFGERLSAYIISQALISGDVACEFLDARAIIRTDNQFGHARVDFMTTNKLIADHFKSHPALQVATGFIASSSQNETTTLGRSGSDYTAAILAGALQATSLEIWTDVDGMMTADPRKVKKAFTVPEMTYQEAMELSHFGAKVVFPATMQPAMLNQIPIWVKNTFNPSFPGTKISAAGNGKDLLIKGISSMGNVSLLSVEGTGLQGVVGVSMRLFTALARERVNVVLISQASSEHSICFAVERKDEELARWAIEKEFHHEISGHEMGSVQVECDLAIVAIVGQNMKHNPGTSGRMFQALGRSGINVFAIAQGSSELNISAVIHQQDVAKALNTLHEAFFLSDRRVVNLFLAGNGLIGRELLGMIAQEYTALAREHLLEVNVVAVANSRKMWFDENGLNPIEAATRLAERGEPMDQELFFQRLLQLNLTNSIFVDCTNSEEITENYETMLAASISIVTPNKKANSGRQEKYRKLKSTAFKRGARFLYETNVGAGLPVLNTLHDLLISGDRVIRIEAVLSGTMNYIFSSFTGSEKFSAIVRQAKEKGYTEPDPREDLNGRDVARKILILAREAGETIELSDVQVQSMVPDDCAQAASVEEFLSRLSAHDDHFEKLRATAEAVGKKLRFMAVYECGAARVELASVGSDHPFFTLQGSDNIILLTTERYHDRPMVIRGPGAGAGVTAAGVFADIIRIGNYAVR